MSNSTPQSPEAKGAMPPREWGFVSTYILQPIVWLVSLPFVLLICVIEAFKKDGGV